MTRPLPHPPGVSTLLLVTLACGCISSGQPVPGSGRPGPDGEWVLTGDQIRQSGARDAWDAIRRVPGWDLRESPSGGPVSVGRRGSGSRALNDAPEIVLDGMRLLSPSALKGIRAEDLERIRLLGGLSAYVTFGRRSGSGLIIVETRQGGRQ